MCVKINNRENEVGSKRNKTTTSNILYSFWSTLTLKSNKARVDD
jgi:hypothetical protein